MYTDKGLHKSVVWLCMTAVFTAMNIALCFFSIPVPGGHLYMNDIVICTGAILMDPPAAFILGGVGAFLGDFLSGYTVAMGVSLLSHGLQALVISLCVHKLFRHSRVKGCLIGTLLGAVIMVTGHTLGRAFIYSTPAYAVMKLPFECLQAGLGVVVSLILCLRYHLPEMFEQIVG